MSAAVLEMSASASAAERLADFARVATDDVDEAAEQIGRIFCPHDLKPAQARAAGFSARHNCAAFDGFSINYVAYGGSVSIDPGCLERFFLLQVPLTGAARIRAGAGEFDAVPDRTASLLSPTIPTRMMWSDCAQVILLLDRRMVEQRAAALSGRVAGTVEFDPVIDLDAPFGQALRTSLAGLMTLAERLGPAGRLSPVATADWREALLDHLLNGQRHGLSDAIRTFSGQAERLPRALRVARDRLADNAELRRGVARSLLAIGDLADVHGALVGRINQNDVGAHFCCFSAYSCWMLARLMTSSLNLSCSRKNVSKSAGVEPMASSLTSS